MIHCEWRPITQSQKALEPIHVWADGRIAIAHWVDGAFHVEQYPYGSYKMDDQPKYYLAVTPPPEG